MAAIARTALDVFPLTLGGTTFGCTSEPSTSFAVLDAFTEAGGNVVDTADVHSAWGEGHTGGEPDTVLGEWLAARGNRDDESVPVALAWLPAKGVTAPLNSASRAERVPALMAAPGLELTGEEVEALDPVSQPFARARPAPPAAPLHRRGRDA